MGSWNRAVPKALRMGAGVGWRLVLHGQRAQTAADGRPTASAGHAPLALLAVAARHVEPGFSHALQNDEGAGRAAPSSSSGGGKRAAAAVPPAGQCSRSVAHPRGVYQPLPRRVLPDADQELVHGGLHALQLLLLLRLLLGRQG